MTMTVLITTSYAARLGAVLSISFEAVATASFI